MPDASAPWVNEAELWPPCRPPVVSEFCWSTSATLLKPRVWMSSAVTVSTGVWFSIWVWGISEPVTVTRSSSVVAASWASALVLIRSRPETTAAASGWRGNKKPLRDMRISVRWWWSTFPFLGLS
ncbi:hypothetical protein D3C86_1049940 [compost metagenome]